MSFTAEVKHELLSINVEKDCEIMAELAAIIRMNGSLQIINKDIAIQLKIFQGELARKVYMLIKNKFNFNMEIRVKKRNHFSHQNIYELFLNPQEGLRKFLIDLGFLADDNNLIFKIKDEFLDKKEYKIAYLRGAFLGGGSINTPESEYHLEFRCEHESLAKDIIQVLEDIELSAHIIEHHSKSVVYLKKYSDIITLLNIIGAYKALLKMENAQVLKDVKNNVNRKVNAETANLDKIIRAAMEQIEAITLIENKKGLDSLTRSLQEIAICRKENPYLSLKELGELFDPPLSKSGVNHRLRRIKKIADRLRREK